MGSLRLHNLVLSEGGYPGSARPSRLPFRRSPTRAARLQAWMFAAFRDLLRLGARPLLRPPLRYNRTSSPVIGWWVGAPWRCQPSRFRPRLRAFLKPPVLHVSRKTGLPSGTWRGSAAHIRTYPPGTPGHKHQSRLFWIPGPAPAPCTRCSSNIMPSVPFLHSGHHVPGGSLSGYLLFHGANVVFTRYV